MRHRVTHPPKFRQPSRADTFVVPLAEDIESHITVATLRGMIASIYDESNRLYDRETLTRLHFGSASWFISLPIIYPQIKDATKFFLQTVCEWMVAFIGTRYLTTRMALFLITLMISGVLMMLPGVLIKVALPFRRRFADVEYQQSLRTIESENHPEISRDNAKKNLAQISKIYREQHQIDARNIEFGISMLRFISMCIMIHAFYKALQKKDMLELCFTLISYTSLTILHGKDMLYWWHSSQRKHLNQAAINMLNDVIGDLPQVSCSMQKAGSEWSNLYVCSFAATMNLNEDVAFESNHIHFNVRYKDIYKCLLTILSHSPAFFIVAYDRKSIVLTLRSQCALPANLKDELFRLLSERQVILHCKKNLLAILNTIVRACHREWCVHEVESSANEGGLQFSFDLSGLPETNCTVLESMLQKSFVNRFDFMKLSSTYGELVLTFSVNRIIEIDFRKIKQNQHDMQRMVEDCYSYKGNNNATNRHVEAPLLAAASQAPSQSDVAHSKPRESLKPKDVISLPVPVNSVPESGQLETLLGALAQRFHSQMYPLFTRNSSNEMPFFICYIDPELKYAFADPDRYNKFAGIIAKGLIIRGDKGQQGFVRCHKRYVTCRGNNAISFFKVRDSREDGRPMVEMVENEPGKPAVVCVNGWIAHAHRG